MPPAPNRRFVGRRRRDARLADPQGREFVMEVATSVDVKTPSRFTSAPAVLNDSERSVDLSYVSAEFQLDETLLVQGTTIQVTFENGDVREYEIPGVPLEAPKDEGH